MKRNMRLVYLVCGAYLSLMAVSWCPLWVKGDMGLGTFWEFLRDVPYTVETHSSVYFRRNGPTTLIILAIGAALGWLLWLGRTKDGMGAIVQWIESLGSLACLAFFFWFADLYSGRNYNRDFRLTEREVIESGIGYLLSLSFGFGFGLSALRRQKAICEQSTWELIPWMLSMLGVIGNGIMIVETALRWLGYSMGF